MGCDCYHCSWGDYRKCRYHSSSWQDRSPSLSHPALAALAEKYGREQEVAEQRLARLKKIRQLSLTHHRVLKSVKDGNHECQCPTLLNGHHGHGFTKVLGGKFFQFTGPCNTLVG